MKQIPLSFLLLQIAVSVYTAEQPEITSEDPYFARFNPKKAPRAAGRVLEKGDRLAICGDSTSPGFQSGTRRTRWSKSSGAPLWF